MGEILKMGHDPPPASPEKITAVPGVALTFYKDVPISVMAAKIKTLGGVSKRYIYILIALLLFIKVGTSIGTPIPHKFNAHLVVVETIVCSEPDFGFGFNEVKTPPSQITPFAGKPFSTYKFAQLHYQRGLLVKLKSNRQIFPKRRHPRLFPQKHNLRHQNTDEDPPLNS
jgi:hypothetical protein